MRAWGALFVLSLTACAPSAPLQIGALPAEATAEQAWRHGIDTLRVADDKRARQSLEQALRDGADTLEPISATLFLRDLAEVRLAEGDVDGTRAAVARARAVLTQTPRTAQFTDEDRRLVERLLAALDHAASDRVSELEQDARLDQNPPSADPWYLLGLTLERQGNAAGARSAYLAYLSRMPHLGYLRRSTQMRAHAQAFVDAVTSR